MSDLPAGREMDALVAEKVVGRRSMPNIHPANPDHSRDEYPCDGFGVGGECSECTGRLEIPGIPAYSTDIAAAWEVVERLLVRRMYPDLVSSNYPVVWTCEVDSYSDPEAATDPWPVKSCADTAPLAICRAALQAVRARADSEPTP